MMTPIKVRIERSLLARSEAKEILTLSQMGVCSRAIQKSN
jgi:hypothetical protein